jgi:hypothetical protein
MQPRRKERIDMATAPKIQQNKVREIIAELLTIHHKLARLDEQYRGAKKDVVAAVRELLKTPHGPVLEPVAELASAEQVLDEANAAIQAARDYCEEWCWEEEGLIEIVLTNAAEAIVTAIEAGQPKHLDALPVALDELLLGRRREAMVMIDDLKESLTRAVEMMQQAAPGATIEVSNLRGFCATELPEPYAADWQSLRTQDQPVLSPLSRHVAVWSTRWALHEAHLNELREIIEEYDHEVHAWVKDAIEQLVVKYKPQADLFREHRSHRAAEHAAGETDLTRFRAQLQQLQDLSHNDVAAIASH